MSIHKVLKEILGVDVFNPRIELVSESIMYVDQVTEGMLLANISFSSDIPLYEESYGSLYIASRDILTTYPGSIKTIRYDDWFFVEPKEVTVTQYVAIKG